ncbi:MAG: M56 family metallopeptidase [Bacteroidales bacterium]|nr:M56 family metallopeptidase [Bacteroidales bacterium]
MISAYFEGLLESALIISAFYLAYVVFLSTEASFRQNRTFLLMGTLLSMFFPFINFSGPQSVQFQGWIELKTIEVNISGTQDFSEANSFTLLNIFCAIYIIGVLFFLARFFRQIFRISRFYANSRIQDEKQVKLVYTGKRHPVFSFLNMIFIDLESEKARGLDAIIKHERIHVFQKHSIDLLLFELLAIVQWLNPIIWWYRYSIKQNHEFLADSGVLKNGYSMDNYQELLLQNYSALNLWLANSFNHSLTFKRLIMMKKNRSNRKSLLKLLVILPVLFTSVYFISCSKDDHLVSDESNNSIENKNLLKSEQSSTIPKESSDLEDIDDSQIFFIVEEMPQFTGGADGLRNFIASNVKYPKAAAENGIEGKVYVRFAVDAEGEVRNVSIARSVSPLLDEEAIRVMKSVPKFIPGKQNGKNVAVWYTVPINFSLK